MRSQFASYLRIGDRRPDLIIRFGYGFETSRYYLYLLVTNRLINLLFSIDKNVC